MLYVQRKLSLKPKSIALVKIWSWSEKMASEALTYFYGAEVSAEKTNKVSAKITLLSISIVTYECWV